MKTYRYEILDGMESVIALADSLEDALYAAEKHGAKLIFDAMNGKCVPFVPYTDLPRCGDYAVEFAEETGSSYPDSLVYCNMD
jgi:hypothetical protein